MKFKDPRSPRLKASSAWRLEDILAKIAAAKDPAAPRFKAALESDGTLELLVYGEVVDAATISMMEAWGYSTDGFVSSLGIKKALNENPTYSSIRLRINSPGGDAFEGMAINSLLSEQAKPVDVFVDGLAASAASIIAMAGRTRTMGRSAMMMIHNAWGACIGNARDMDKMRETLNKVDESIAQAYVCATELTADKVLALMGAETWMTAQDCVAQGFATAVVEAPAKEENAAIAMASKFNALGRLQKVPTTLKAKTGHPKNADGECECECPECMDGDHGNCTNADCVDENCLNCPMQQSAEARVSVSAPPPARQPLRPPVAPKQQQPAAAESNLSLYKARLKMLLRAA